jgi:hypothetical protein
VVGGGVHGKDEEEEFIVPAGITKIEYNSPNDILPQHYPSHDLCHHLLTTTIIPVHSDKVFTEYDQEDDNVLSQRSLLETNSRHGTNHRIADAHDVMMTIPHHDHYDHRPSPYVGFSNEIKPQEEVYDTNRTPIDTITTTQMMNHSNTGSTGNRRKLHRYRSHRSRSIQNVNQYTLIGCVYNEADLSIAINTIPNIVPTHIDDVCASYLTINTNQPKGILLQAKILEIYCNQTKSMKNMTPHPCTIDGQHISRIFCIVLSHIIIHDSIFTNGNGTENINYLNGEAHYVKDSSIVCYTGPLCSRVWDSE